MSEKLVKIENVANIQFKEILLEVLHNRDTEIREMVKLGTFSSQNMVLGNPDLMEVHLNSLVENNEILDFEDLNMEIILWLNGEDSAINRIEDEVY